ncbi:MAG TPA: protein kinase [Polyangia bacterium]|jgi:serine/threonine-protein kinase|nr:protein kinase [Polyangia bacterium]
MKDPQIQNGPENDATGLSTEFDRTELAVPHGSPIARPPPGIPGAALEEIHQVIAGRYQILRLLGSGGMGNVYCVRDAELNETVALKMLRRELDGSAVILERFRQEVRLARRVTHPNVARTFDIGEHQGQKFLTMEYIEGEVLSAVLRREKALLFDRAIDILMQLCAGLAAAHAAGVIHRDLKPANVMLTREGRVVVTDFGVAHANLGCNPAQAVYAVGTPAYMAPEQVVGTRDIDARADLYALGALAYELFTGKLAWPNDKSFAAVHARLTSPPPDPRLLAPDLSEELALLVMRLMAPHREDRFARTEEVLARLTGIRAAMTTLMQGPADTLSQGTPLPVVPERTSSTGRGDKTVAVLPFRNGGVPEEDYIADGLTEDLIDTLSLTRGLKVRPRGVVMRLKGWDGDPRDKGRELEVQVVVEGSIRKMRDAYRLTARLISVADGFQIWARRVDCPAVDLLVASDDFARTIAEALTTDMAAPAREAASDPAAIELYLRARFELRNGWHSSAAVDRAVTLCEEALTRLPSDPMIAATCAVASARLAFIGGARISEALALARHAAERAVAMAPHLGESWVALASVRLSELDPAGAVRALRSAISAAPRLARAWEMLGRLLLEAGRLEEAIIHLEAALRLDPSTMEPRWDLARSLAMREEWARVDTLLQQPVDESARTIREVFRARLSMWRARERAFPALTGGDVPGDGIPRMLILIFREIAATGKLREEWRGYLVEQAGIVSARLKPVIWQYQAETLMALEDADPEGALQAVTEAATAELTDIAWVDYCPLLGPLRSDPRWEALRACVAARAFRTLQAVTSVTTSASALAV